jgi:CheY-like chemotaxis protein
MDNKKRIVWIDDYIDTPILRPYVDEFEDNDFEVIKIKEVSNFMEILKKEAKKTVSAILVDILMPPQHFDFSETRGGLRTGIVVIKQILKEGELKGIPIVAFTNVDDSVINEFCREKHIQCIEKRNYFSDEFVAKIDEIINAKQEA